MQKLENTKGSKCTHINLITHKALLSGKWRSVEIDANVLQNFKILRYIRPIFISSPRLQRVKPFRLNLSKISINFSASWHGKVVLRKLALTTGTKSWRQNQVPLSVSRAKRDTNVEKYQFTTRIISNFRWKLHPFIHCRDLRCSFLNGSVEYILTWTDYVQKCRLARCMLQLWSTITKCPLS